MENKSQSTSQDQQYMQGVVSNFDALVQITEEQRKEQEKQKEELNKQQKSLERILGLILTFVLLVIVAIVAIFVDIFMDVSRYNKLDNDIHKNIEYSQELYEKILNLRKDFLQKEIIIDSLNVKENEQ